MRIGIDLGGTKIEIVALAEDGGETLRRRIDAPDFDIRHGGDGNTRARLGQI